MLLDLPRTLSSRYISALSKNDVISLKPVHQIATGTQGTVATQQVKVNVYMERLQVQRAEGLNEPKLKKMSEGTMRQTWLDTACGCIDLSLFKAKIQVYWMIRKLFSSCITSLKQCNAHCGFGNAFNATTG